MFADRTKAASIHLLAISDLHLGLDLRRHRTPTGEAAQDAALESLLDHYERTLESNGRWRLIVAGDMVDFIGITLTPSPDEAVPFRVSDEERHGGLAAEASKAVWKLRKVVERHRRFVSRLASFIARGNELFILRGNHDQEWSFPSVRQAFVEGLWSLLPDEDRAGHARRADFEARIRFHDWFYLEPGKLFIEHGHLHDEFSSGFDVGHRSEERELHEPVSTLALRWFASRHEGLDMNAVDRWTFGDYIRWAVTGRCFKRALGDYVSMTARLIARSVSLAIRPLRAGLGRGRYEAMQQAARLRTILAAIHDDHAPFAKRMAGLWRAPADESVLLIARLLYVDRFALTFATIAAATAGALALEHEGWRWRVPALIVAAALLTNQLLARRRHVESHPKLLRVAERVARLLGVETVVMGHSHHPVDVRLPGGARYFNLGSWLPRKQEATEGFRHLVFDADGPRLLSWPLPAPARAREG